MRILLDIQLPHKPFNSAVRKGTAGSIIRKILEETSPEAVYFTEREGRRAVTLIAEVKKASDVPSLSEPWFLNFNADCHFHIIMSSEDLHEAGLEELGKKWGQSKRNN